MSVLRYYDESILTYLKDNITYLTPEGPKTPQITLALPSRQGAKLELTDNKTPVLPLISVIRSGLSPNNETKIVKSRIIRPQIINLKKNMKLYDGIMFMPFNISYQLDYFSLSQEIFNILTEKLLYNLYKKHYVKTFIEIGDVNLEINGYLTDISFSDATSYIEIPDTETRIFHGTIGFILYTQLLNDEFYIRSVLNTQYDINVDNTTNIKAAFDVTVEDNI